MVHGSAAPAVGGIIPPIWAYAKLGKRAKTTVSAHLCIVFTALVYGGARREAAPTRTPKDCGGQGRTSQTEPMKYITHVLFCTYYM